MSAWDASPRGRLPKPSDRILLGRSGLSVSPLCLGMTSPETVLAAYESGINFFFLTGDLHWPLYCGVREGLTSLLKGSPGRRHEIVVAVVSYLDNPLFAALQFHEVIDAVPGLGYVDLIIAGAVSGGSSFSSRLDSLVRARAARHVGATAIGATFHQRSLALAAHQYDVLDISYVRYNSAHPSARLELFPYFRADRAGLVYNFKSVMSRVTPEMFEILRLPKDSWLPAAGDYYRFVLSRPELDGILCSPASPDQLKDLVRALDKPPLSSKEEDYMVQLSALAHRPVLT